MRNLMKMSAAICLLFVCLSAFGQNTKTNSVDSLSNAVSAHSTNIALAKYQPPQTPTMAQVQAGLNVISNQIAAIKVKRAAIATQWRVDRERLDLQMKAGQIGKDERFDQLTKSRLSPQRAELEKLDKQKATLELQAYDIRKRYGIQPPPVKR